MTQLLSNSLTRIDTFVDALWLEEGLSKNTLAAYRRDLTLFSQWLAVQTRTLDQTLEADLQAYFAYKHEQTKATTANRRLTVFKRYFRWALREGALAADPTLKLQSAKQALRVPKTLTEAQVEALLAAPDTTQALGIRDRAMLELMYASGLRVSELVTLKTLHVSLNDNVLRIMGKAPRSGWFLSVRWPACGSNGIWVRHVLNCWRASKPRTFLSPHAVPRRALPWAG
jgi:integrase/recombinase XerD